MMKSKVGPSFDVGQSSDSHFVPFPMKNKEEVHVDWLGRFVDNQIQSEYLDYCVFHQTPSSFFILSSLFLLWAFLETSAYLTIRSHLGHELIYGLVSFLLIFLCMAFGSLIFSYNTQKKVILWISRHTAQLWFTVFFNLLFLFKVAKYFFLDPVHCIISPLFPERDFDDVCNRNESFAAVFLPSPEMVFIIAYFALLLPILLHKPRLYYLSSNLIIAFSFFIYCFHTSSFGNILPLMLTEILVVVLFCNFHHERMQGYLHYRHYQLYFQEQQKLDEIKAENIEIRQMVGNVAHDLKTPLASFTNGVNIIHDLLKKSQETIRSLKADQADSLTEIGLSIESCLVNIQNTNTFMLMSINRFLDFTKLGERKKLSPKYETLNLQEILQFPVDCMSNIQEKIEIELAPLHEGICSHIITDKQWLQENILCLLSNAVKYSSEGKVIVSASVFTQYSQSPAEMRSSSPSPVKLPPIIAPSTLESAPSKPTFPGPVKASGSTTVTTRSSTDRIENERSNSFHSRASSEQNEEVKSYLLFEVEDNGIGMSIEAQASLFSPFKQAQSLAGGTGLGLFSLSKRIEALKGTYGVRSRKDGKKGSLFWFTIPYRPDHLTATSPAVETPTNKTRTSLKSTRTPKLSGDVPSLELLLVDDSPSIVKMSSMMLKRQGHVITSAENGEIALKKIEEKWKSTGKGFDLVLMDLQMPVMDGLEATRRLRQMESEGLDWMQATGNSTCRCHQLIFGTSANYDIDTQEEAMEAGIDDFLDKPFTLDSLISLLQIHCV